MSENRLCPECSEPIIGRIDKKFCSDQCRNTYNNKSKGYSTSYVRKINGILSKNRRVLEKLNPKGKTKVHLKQLEKEGFNFNFYTNIYTTKTGNIYYFCYEHGYLALEDKFYALVIRDAPK